MDRRPWPIVVLAVLHFVEPLAKLGFYSLLWNMPVGGFFVYLQYQATLLEIFMFFGAFPLAGALILAVKRWSLPAFFLVQVATFVGHIYYHLTAPKAFPLGLILTLSAMNLAVVTYFLLPAVRLAYINPRVRWWESKPRYLVDWTGQIFQGKKKLPIHISNISEGGLFASVTSKGTLDVQGGLTVQFDFLNYRFELEGAIRHEGAVGNSARYGVEFTALTDIQRAQLKRCTRALQTLEYPRMGAPEGAWDSFREWASTLIRTGRGFVPEVKKPGASGSTQKTVGPAEKPRKSA